MSFVARVSGFAVVGTLVLGCGDTSGQDDGGTGGAGLTSSSGGAGGVASSTGGASTSTTTTTTASTTVTVSSGSTTTGGGGAGPVPGATHLGRGCQADAACGALDCIETDSGAIAGAAPQGGVCTKACVSHAQCPPNGHCVDFGGAGLCMLACEHGEGTPKADKCRGRDDFACTELISQGNIVSGCTPTCQSDAACGAGLFCNYQTGLCQPTDPPGDPMGTQCDPNGVDTCAGHCECVDASCLDGFCTGYCTYGSSTYSCGGIEGDGWCGLTYGDGGAGDLGACMALCQCDGECSPAHVCNQLNGADQQALGYNGVCYTQVATTFPICCDCTGLVCGDDGCGTSCGTCSPGEACTNGGTCCSTCGDAQCGPDGCGGTCGTCAGNEICTAQGECECVPDCTGKVCGDDGCGGSCGTCPLGDVCDAGACCQPACDGLECGPDGCGTTCGACAPNEACDANGLCQCVPNCTGKTCGTDGCGGSCGTCAGPAVCASNGTCCTPDCAGKNCGPDGCGGSCGTCSGTCNNGVCCQPQIPCGSDLHCCGGVCGLITGACYACLPNGEFCTDHGDCCSDACGPSTCQNCLNESQECETNSQCCNGKCAQALGACNVNCTGAGLPCASNSSCCSNSCQGGFCTAAP